MQEEGEDWIMRPCLRGLCSYVELMGLSLFDVARMNEALDVEAENQYRAQEAAKR